MYSVFKSSVATNFPTLLALEYLRPPSALKILISAFANGAPSNVTLPFSISFPSCAEAAKPKRINDSMKRCFTNEREMSAKRTNLLNVICLQNSAAKDNKMDFEFNSGSNEPKCRLPIGR